MKTTPDTKRTTLRLKSLLLSTAAAAVLALPAYVAESGATASDEPAAQSETETQAGSDTGGSAAGTGSHDAAGATESGSDADTVVTEDADPAESAADATEEAKSDETADASSTETVTTEGGTSGSDMSAAADAEMKWSEAAANGSGFLASAPENTIEADALIGSDIAGADGETIGKVKDLLMDAEGTLRGLVISSGGFLGIGDKSVAVFWDPATMRMDGGVLLTSLTEESVKNAPEFLATDAKPAAEVRADEAPEAE